MKYPKVSELLLPRLTTRIAGLWKMEAWVPDANGREMKGSRRLVADWFPNLFLDSGLNALMTTESNGNLGNITAWCHVGSGTSAPLESQTQLDQHRAGVGRLALPTNGGSNVRPYYGMSRTVYQFQPGFASSSGSVILREVGCARDQPIDTLRSRSRITDGAGVNTDIEIFYNEYLEVTYELRQYPPELPNEDYLQTLAIAGVVYDVIVRPSQAGGGSAWSQTQNGFSNPSQGIGAGTFSGNIGVATAEPIGALQFTQNSPAGYATNSFRRQVPTTFPINGPNTPVRSVTCGPYRGKFQAQFNAQGTGLAIPKTDKHELRITWEFAVDQRPPPP